MKSFILYTCSLLILTSSTPTFSQLSSNEYVALSQKFLNALKNKSDSSEWEEGYNKINLDQLKSSLDTEEKQLAFWINTYNAFILFQLQSDPSTFEDRSTFYKAEKIKIGGEIFSFDLIEHGIIRNSRWKLGLGYIKKIGASKIEKKLRLKGKDGRVHFALNCGAKSCPPVFIYNDMTFNKDIDLIIKSYLPRVTTQEGKEVVTSPLFNWFRGDFGGSRGIVKFLASYDIIQDEDVNISYGDYDWTLDLNNFYP